MGVFWFVDPFDAEGKARAEALDVEADFPVEGNRLPTVDELRATLRAMKDVRTEGAEVPPGTRWEVWIENGDDSTTLLADVTGGTITRLTFDKGREDLIVDILQPHSSACGVLMVSNDSDGGVFFVGPGIDPYEDGAYAPEDVQGLSVSPELGREDLITLSLFLRNLLKKKSVNPDDVAMDVDPNAGGSRLEVVLIASNPDAQERLPEIVKRAVEKFRASQTLGTLTDGGVKELIARVGPLTLTLRPRP